MSRHFWKTADCPPPLEHPVHRCHRDIFGGGGGTTNTNTIQKADPWEGVQPYLRDLFGRAQSQSFAPQLAGQSPYTLQAIQQQAQMAQDPNSLIGMSQRQLGSTIAGDYLSVDKNPAMQEAINAARRTVNSQFSGDNYGSSAHQEWLARGAAGAVAPMLQQERQNQLGALQMAPGLQTANLGLLSSAGAMQDARAQAELDAPHQALSRYQALISGQGGGTTSGSTETPYFTNPLSSAFGLGLGTLGLYALSDRRLKSNIRRVGTHPLGIGIYTYEIGGESRIGVMADEVEVVKPEAVVEVGPFKAVDYARLA
jgi:hypothetical protein